MSVAQLSAASASSFVSIGADCIASCAALQRPAISSSFSRFQFRGTLASTAGTSVIDLSVPKEPIR
jgi:hypothetical protein